MRSSGSRSGADTRAVSPLRVIARDRACRRLALASAIFIGSEYAVWVALMVYAYQQGGAAESGIVALTQLIPAAAFAPLAGVLAERGAPEQVLRAGYWVQGIALGCAALTVAMGGAPVVVYGFMVFMSIAITTTRPAQALVTPWLAKSPQELTALNVVTEWTAQSAIFIAPMIAGAILSVSNSGAVFAVFSAALMLGAVAVSGLPRCGGFDPGDAIAGTWSQVAAGLRVVGQDRAVRLVLVLSGIGFMVVGALDVMIVVLAIDRLQGTAADAAWMTAALGAGGVLGASASGLLIGRRLAPALGAAALGIGVSLALVGLISTETAAYVLFFAAGSGLAILGVAGLSLLQRTAPSDSVGRIFALRESLISLGLAIGSIAAPVLVAQFGTDGAFILLGAVLPLTVAGTVGAIWRLDAAANVPIVELALLRRLQIFGYLPAPALEGLARNATPVIFAAGSLIMSEGAPGDRYFAITSGDVEVLRGGVIIGHRSDGEGVGEAALLQSIPRTATVRARTAVQTLAIEKHDFLIAILGQDASRHDSGRQLEP